MISVEATDWHVHYFRDGCAEPEMTVESVLAAAAEKGIEELGLLGHFRNRMVISDLAYWTEPNPKFFDLLRRDVSEAGHSALPGRPVKVHIGAEVDINTIGGDLSITNEQASRIDYVMIGIHWPPTLPPLVDYIDLQEPARLLEAYCSYNRIRPEDFSVERLIGDMFTSMINAIARNPFVHILAHPAGFATSLGMFCIEMGASEWFEKLANALAANHVAYELNAGALREYSPEALEGFVKPLMLTCARAGVMFTVGSDAHRIDEVGDLGLALQMREELEIPDDRFITRLEGFQKKSA